MSRYRWCLSLSCLLALVVFTACKGDCRKLAEKLCDCSANTVEKNTCIQTAATEEGRVGTTPSDEALCAKLYNGCDCHTINTAAGKQACGLARLPPDGGVSGT